MKTRNLFLGLFAFAALCACNKEEQPDVPQVLNEDAYINVSILADNTYTKASDQGFENGSEAESAVKNIIFAFFGSDGKFLYSVADKDVTWTEDKRDTPAIERISNAVVVLKRHSITPTQMVVVLNYGDAVAESLDGDGVGDISNLADMYSNITTHDYLYSDGVNSYFTMSNSSYWKNGKNAFAAQITSDNIYTMADNPGLDEDVYRGQQTPVEVYVERIAAKLSVTGNPTGTPKTLELINGTNIQYYPVIKNYGFTYTRNDSRLCKNIEDLYSQFLTSWPGWNDENNRRSYWAKPYDGAGLNKLAYDQITGSVPGYVEYCHENTTSSTTKLIVSASLKKMTGAVPDAGDPDLEVVRVGASSYYIKDELLASIAQKFVTAGILKSNDTDFTSNDFDFTPAVAGEAYESDITIKVGVTPKSGNETKISEILEDYANVLYWGSQIYFFTDVEHFGLAAGTDKGVVRNHYYQLTVSSIAGLGTPFVPGIGGGEIDPEIPESVDHELQARINILKWKVVSQDVALGN